jgi:tRNA(fMet)-specific endonuclease VapC
MRFLLDATILSDLIQAPNGRVAARIRRVGEDNICTSVIVAAELRYGTFGRDASPLAANTEAILGAINILPFDPPADRTYGELRAQLEQTGQSIGGNSLLIAAQALSAGCAIATRNVQDFARIPDLYWENWLDA